MTSRTKRKRKKGLEQTYGANICINGLPDIFVRSDTVSEIRAFHNFRHQGVWRWKGWYGTKISHNDVIVGKIMIIEKPISMDAPPDVPDSIAKEDIIQEQLPLLL